MVVKKVCSVEVLDSIAATFVEDELGWRFGRWQSGPNRLVPYPPTKTDRERHFDSIETAARFFRDQYGDLLPQ